MSDEEYLWSRRGEPTPDVARLEKVLGELRWSQRRLNTRRAKHFRLRRPELWQTVAAAALLLSLGGSFLIWKMHTQSPVTSWELSLGNHLPKPVRAGQLIETNNLTAATMKSDGIGAVGIEPNSRLRLLPDHNGQRLALDHGVIHALIWAPPAQFVVDTPSAKAVDLGCQYTLRVAKDGQGFLTVEAGWVAFQWHNVESFIPAGAACTTRPGHGPDTPHFLDAPEIFTKAVAEFDLTGNMQELYAALPAARPRDCLTLWHLLQRTQGQDRAKVFDRFAKLVPLPPGLTREGLLRGDPKAMDAAWDALQLGNTSWWREWKREW
jgi:hypothetical protein